MNNLDLSPNNYFFLYSIITKEFVSLSKHKVSIRNSSIVNSELTKSTPTCTISHYNFSLKQYDMTIIEVELLLKVVIIL